MRDDDLVARLGGDEFAAEPGHEVVVARAPRQPPRRRAQQLVADRVAEAVVDRLEVVEVDEQDRDTAPAGLRRPRIRIARSRNSARLASPVSGSW